MESQKVQSKVLLDDSNQINIKISQAQLSQNGYITYKIIGFDKKGNFQIRRRFNDFFILRQTLRKKWPGCYIPPIPSKSLTGGRGDKFVQERRRQLEYFCTRLAMIKYIYYSTLVQQFLHQSVQIQKIQEIIIKQPTEKTVKIYQQLLTQYEMTESINDMKVKVNGFYEYIKSSEKELKRLKEEMKGIATAKRQFQSSLNHCNISLIPEYQKNVFKQYLNDHEPTFLFSGNSQVQQKINELKTFTFYNSFDVLVDLISLELKEVLAFKDSIQFISQNQQNIRKLEEKRKGDIGEVAKLIANKLTLKSIFTKGSKEQQKKALQKSLVEDEAEIKNLKILGDQIAVLVWYQINRFKIFKSKLYYKILIKMSKMQVKHLHLYGNFIKLILSHNENLKFN